MKNQDGPGDELFETWIAGYEKGDVGRIMSIYDGSAIYQEPCYPPKTYSALKDWYEFDFSRSGPRPTWKYEIESAEASGSLAVIVSRWVGYTDYGTRQQAEVRRLRSIDFLRLGSDGWKIFRTLNDPEPCVGKVGRARPPKKPRRKK